MFPFNVRHNFVALLTNRSLHVKTRSGVFSLQYNNEILYLIFMKEHIFFVLGRRYSRNAILTWRPKQRKHHLFQSVTKLISFMPKQYFKIVGILQMTTWTSIGVKVPHVSCEQV